MVIRLTWLKLKKKSLSAPGSVPLLNCTRKFAFPDTEYSTIKSPQILELSGIGRPDVLTKIGVKTKVALSGVGENVQDHISCRFAFELNPQANHENYDLMRDPEYDAKEMKLLYVYFAHLVRRANTTAVLKARVTIDGVSLHLPSSRSPAPIRKTHLL
jgi:hypothetical protein